MFRQNMAPLSLLLSVGLPVFVTKKKQVYGILGIKRLGNKGGCLYTFRYSSGHLNDTGLMRDYSCSLVYLQVKVTSLTCLLSEFITFGWDKLHLLLLSPCMFVGIKMLSYNAVCSLRCMDGKAD